MNTLVEAPSIRSRIPGLLEDHFELAQLECRYEYEAGRRRLGWIGLAVLCLSSAFALLQVTLIEGLRAAGLPLYAACLMLAVLWSVIGIGVYLRCTTRDPKAGEPFMGTRAEFKRSFQWIQTHFF